MSKEIVNVNHNSIKRYRLDVSPTLHLCRYKKLNLHHQRLVRQMWTRHVLYVFRRKSIFFDMIHGEAKRLMLEYRVLRWRERFCCHIGVQDRWYSVEELVAILQRKERLGICLV